MRIGKVFMVGLVCLFVSIGFMACECVPDVYAEEKGVMENIIDEAKTWNYSLGDYAYLIKEGKSYYGVGIQKDVGQYIDRIGEDWIYGDLGYLNTIGNTSKQKDYVYFGASLNAGKFVAGGIEWTFEQFGTEIEMPKFLKENMMKVGYIAATRFDKDDFFKVWDHGPRVRIIEIKLPLGK